VDGTCDLGIAVLGVLAGSLASPFNLESGSEDEHADDAAEAERSVTAELAMLHAQLREVERRLGQLAEVISTQRGEPE
jgi:hypothetical protein